MDIILVNVKTCLWNVPLRLGKKLNRPLMILSHFRDRGNKEKLSGRKIHAVGRELLTDIRASNHARDSNLAFPPPTILRSTFFFELDLESCPSPFPRPLFARPSCLSHSRSLTRSLFLFHSHSLARSFSLTRARSLSLSRARSLSLSHSRSLARLLALSLSLSLSPFLNVVRLRGEHLLLMKRRWATAASCRRLLQWSFTEITFATLPRSHEIFWWSRGFRSYRAFRFDSNRVATWYICDLILWR